MLLEDANPELGPNHLDSHVFDETSDIISKCSTHLALPLKSS